MRELLRSSGAILQWICVRSHTCGLEPFFARARAPKASAVSNQTLEGCRLSSSCNSAPLLPGRWLRAGGDRIRGAQAAGNCQFSDGSLGGRMEPAERLAGPKSGLLGAGCGGRGGSMRSKVENRERARESSTLPAPVARSAWQARGTFAASVSLFLAPASRQLLNCLPVGRTASSQRPTWSAEDHFRASGRARRASRHWLAVGQLLLDRPPSGACFSSLQVAGACKTSEQKCLRPPLDWQERRAWCSLRVASLGRASRSSPVKEATERGQPVGCFTASILSLARQSNTYNFSPPPPRSAAQLLSECCSAPTIWRPVD